MNVYNFLYKLGQSWMRLTSDKPNMQSKKDRREYKETYSRSNKCRPPASAQRASARRCNTCLVERSTPPLKMRALRSFQIHHKVSRATDRANFVEVRPQLNSLNQVVREGGLIDAAGWSSGTPNLADTCDHSCRAHGHFMAKCTAVSKLR